MRLCRLTIHSLPGIEPGFTFEPGGDNGTAATGGNAIGRGDEIDDETFLQRVIVVTGPNAIGKSSLVRALGHLLSGPDKRNDPPGLHLEAEFLSGNSSGGVRWTVRRTGRQVVWMRDGESAAPPPLPGAGQFGLYRLSVESLLADDAGDRDLAAELWRMLRGGFDLDGAKRLVGPRFGGTEARNLTEKARALRAVEGAYADLRRQEAQLPDLERRIARSDRAEARARHLQTALDLREAIDERKACAEALEGYSAHMAHLHDDELEILDKSEDQVAKWRKDRAAAEREIEAGRREIERTGLQDARPDAETMAGMEKSLHQAELDLARLDQAGEDLVKAGAVLEDAKAQLASGRKGTRAQLAGDQEDANAQYPGGHEDGEARLSGDREDAKAKFDGGHEGAEVQLAGDQEGAAAQLAGGQEDAKARLAGGHDDVKAQRAGGPGHPKLDSDSLVRAREILEPLVEAQFRRKELQQRLELAGAPPDETELGQYRDCAGALRAWLAARAADRPSVAAARVWFVIRIVWWATLTMAVLFAGFAFRAEAWSVFGIGLSGIAVLLTTSWAGRRSAVLAEAPLRDARRRYAETGLEPPPEWRETPVREHLRRVVQSRFDDLRLQRKQAEGVERIRQKIEQLDSRIAELEGRSGALAREIGIDPALTGAPLYRFIEVTGQFNQARAAHARTSAAVKDLADRVGKRAKAIRDFLEDWREKEAPRLGAAASREDLNALGIAFDSLKARMAAASDAQGIVETRTTEIGLLDGNIDETERDIAKLFERAGLEAGGREDLVRMIDRLGDWSRDRKALDEAETEEKRLRTLLADEGDLIETVESVESATVVESAMAVDSVEHGAVHALKSQLRAAEQQAGERTELIKKESAINTRLEEARKSRKLEDAARAKDQAAEALRDKRDEVLACAATEVLLDDVESAFKAEREPELLRRARRWFERVTAHAFTLELRDTNSFVAHDVTQGEPRALNKLSSGTRMQLLLALRLAWTEDRERGGEPLPLLFDEALTMSDEGRFSVMARTLSSLADGGRQIFYLSARRQDAALWEQATGTAPMVIDLAAVRFGSAPADPGALRVETPPALPPPDGLEAEEYAALIRVHPVNPRADAGGIHLFHLLRDDLGLLHSLLDTWRIGTLGQLESLLGSDAAGSAVRSLQSRQRLATRCRAAGIWVELWRQGRGRRVGRAVLDECPAVSDIFLERAARLSRELDCDGAALVRALRSGRISGFFSSKMNELEEWLKARRYIDEAVILEPEERRRLTLQRVVPTTATEADDVNRVVDWMESAVASIYRQAGWK